jgi:tetratricopeptide (TPR) repeat protein
MATTPPQRPGKTPAGSPPATRTTRRRRLSLPKLLAFAFFTVILFFTGGEALLALLHVRPIVETEDPYVGFVSSLPLFVEQSLPDGRAVMRTASNKLAYFNPQEFPKVKPKNTFRIFCLGGSTTYGHPYNDLTSYCGWLREILPRIDPSRHWEVINAGGVSYASYREAALMEELARYSPDAFIVYTGHNEFLERRTYSSLIEANPGVTWLGSMVGRTRTYAVVRSAIRAVQPDRETEARKQYQMTGEVDALLDAMVGLSAYTRDDTLQSRIVEHYGFNLHRMARIARNANARLVYVTVASNLKDTSPFKSQHTPGLNAVAIARSETLLANAKSAHDHGDLDTAHALLQQAVKLDPRWAVAHYELGHVLFEQKRFNEALQHFVRARDEDVCPLRQLSVMRDVKLEVAASEHDPVVDLVKIIADSTQSRFGHRIPGEEFFLDHAHPTIEGNRILATALARALIADGVLEAPDGWESRILPEVTAHIESQIDPKLQAVALRNLARLFSWAGKLDEAERMAKQSLELDPDQMESLVVLGSRAAAEGRADEAMEYYKQVLKRDPNHLEARNNLAVELARRGQNAEALEQYEAMLRINPNQPAIYFNAGQAFVRMGRFDRAIDQFEHALQLRPEDVNTLTSLGRAQAHEGQLDDASKTFHRAIELEPDDADAHLGLATTYAQQRRAEDSMAELEEALRVAPNNARVQCALGLALLERQDLDGAERHLADAIRLDPNLPEAHNGLGTVQWRQGDLDAAMASFGTELRINPNHPSARNNQAYLLAEEGHVREAMTVYRSLLEKNPNDAMTYNSLAWLLATQPEADLRDGKAAVELALKANKLTGFQHPVALNTLAAAYAEEGRFEEAIETSEKAIQTAQASGQQAMVHDFEHMLELYKQGQPYHTPSHTP